MLEQYKIQVKITRGRISYLPERREKYIRGRMLGTDYELDSIKRRLQKEVQNEAEREVTREQFDISKDYQIPPETVQFIYIKTRLRLVTDLQNNIKAELSKSYARKVKIFNLKEMAKAVAYAQEHKLDSVEDIEMLHNGIKAELTELQNGKRDIRQELRDTNQTIHFLGQFFANRAVYRQYEKSGKREDFRTEHLQEIQLYEEARDYIYENYGEGVIPDINRLREHREELNQWKSGIQDRIKTVKEREKDFFIIKENINYILNMNQQKTRKTPEL
jgi:hypothetical protein